MSIVLEKAEEAAEAARQLLACEHYESACGRAYFAMFNTARFLLAEIEGFDLETIRKHKTVFNLFSKHFVRTGRFDRVLARQFRESSEIRAIADYDERHVEAATAIKSVEVMEMFLARARQLREERKDP